MFRTGANNALYQGDVLVLPEVALRDRDPCVMSREKRQIRCGNCNEKVEDKRVCDHCQAPLPTPEKNVLRITGLSARQGSGEDIFAKSSTPEIVASLKTVVVVIESHSCDIDRQDELAVWTVRPLTSLSSSQQLSIRKGENGSLMLLEDAGALPPCVIDFNSAFNVPAWVVGKRVSYTSRRKGGPENALLPFAEVVGHRFTSLDSVGLKMLYEAKIRHLTRFEFDLDLPEIEPDDPDRPTGPIQNRGWALSLPKWARQESANAAG